jgi:VWFA-related protein
MALQITLRGMTRLLLASAAAAVLAVHPAAWKQRAASILIDAVALDGNGNPVLDLKPVDLDVRVGQFHVPVDSLELVTPESPGREGRVIVLLMDDLTLPQSEVPRAREVANRFVSRMLPGDSMAVVRLNNPSFESTDDPAKLRGEISRFNVTATGVLRVDDVAEHVLGTIESIARGITEAGDGRKVIVGIGTGGLFDRPIPPPNTGTGRNLLPNWIACMKALATAHAAFYVIYPTSIGSVRADSGDTGFARETGGRAFIGANDLNLAADRILRETTTYYLVRVASPPTGGSGLRELQIKTSRRGVTIRARKAI